jgi:hypothetical protein
MVLLSDDPRELIRQALLRKPLKVATHST